MSRSRAVVEYPLKPMNPVDSTCLETELRQALSDWIDLAEDLAKVAEDYGIARAAEVLTQFIANGYVDEEQLLDAMTIFCREQIAEIKRRRFTLH